jgi:hypothetical protein
MDAMRRQTDMPDAVPDMGLIVTFHQLYGAWDGDSWTPTEEGCALIRGTDLIIGQDIDTGRKCVLYGMDALRGVIASGKPMQARTLTIRYDQDTDELEHLCALILVEKGSHDYPR